MQFKIISLNDSPYTGKPSIFAANCSSAGKTYQIYKDTEGNGFVSPLPSTDELTSFYTKPYFDEKFNEKKNVDRANKQAETIKKSSFFTPQGMLLDVGAGNGYFLQALQKLGLKVFGVEPAQAAVDKALSRGLSSDEIMQGDIKDVPRNHYDYISVMDVLEHLLPADLELMFNKLLELMSDDTTLFVKTFFNDDPALLKFLGGEEAYWQAHSWEHVFVPSAKGLAEILLSHGLEIKEILKQEKSGPIVSVRKITDDYKEAKQRVDLVVAGYYSSGK